MFNVWLGGLLNPEAYITATRQCIAQANSWSLEELVLDVTITDGGLDASKPSLDDCSFGVVGKFSDCLSGWGSVTCTKDEMELVR